MPAVPNEQGNGGSPDFRVGRWLVQPTMNSIVGAERSTHVEPKVMQVLVYLAEHAGEVVAKERLIGTIWADTFVTDEVLTRSISELRKALGDDARDPRIIQTIPKSGYRLMVPVEPPTSVGPPPELRHAAGRRLAITAAFLLGLFHLAGYYSWQYLRPSAPASTDKVMLAVLPFENLSGDAEQDYFSDGLTEEMITQLGRLHPQRLGVIARTSAMQFKSTEKSIDEIGRALKVDYILEGSVRREGQQVRITAQLIQVQDQSHLWAASYQRDLASILNLQTEVAGEIARSLTLELLPAQKRQLARQRSVQPESYEAYLMGRYHWNKRTQQGLEKSLKHFQQAIQKDPTYAPAYAGMADTYLILGQYGYLQRDQAFAKTKQAALKALEIDNSLGEAHASLAAVLESSEWDWAGAEAGFQQAIELNPAYATAHQWYADFLAEMGRLDESVDEIERALELDPLSLIIRANGGKILIYARRYDDAVEQCQKVLEMDADFLPAHACLGLAYAMKGMDEEALHHARKFGRLPLIGFAHALAGQREKALEIVQELEEHPRSEFYSSTATIALIYAHLGETEQAFAWLERAYQERAIPLSLKVDPMFDPLRSDLRFHKLLRRMNIPG